MKIYPLLTIFLAISLFGLLFFQLFLNSDVEEFNQKSLAPFESKLLNGDSFTSEQLKNDSLSLINVWATWCVGCRLEHSYLM
jgi:thiol-disulfide isomerase/thioredoxin